MTPAERQDRISQGIGMAEVKPVLQARALELARMLAPGGTLSGKVYAAGNPTRGEARGSSFVIWIKGPAAGAFTEYDSGEKGDIFDLIIYCQQARTKAEALAWAKGFCGLDGASPARLKEIRATAKQQSIEAEKAQKAEDARRMAWAKSVWLQSAPMKPGDASWQYLTIAREIDLPRLWAIRPLNVLRTAGQLSYAWPEIATLEDEIARGKTGAEMLALRPADGKSIHPAMIAAMSPAAKDAGRAVHRTWLSPGGMGKARVPKAKKMAGLSHATAIRLWRGETGLSEREAIRRGAKTPLVLTEGIEDGLSIAASAPEYRVWPVGSLNNLGLIDWPEVASEVIIAADNDWEKPQAVALFNAACQRLSQWGRVRVARASEGKDFNDQLRMRRQR
jgi:hypothetical protein